MTIQNNGTRISYVASSSQTIFPYPFRIFEATDLLVYQNGTLLAYSTNYTVTGVDEQTGGNVVLNVGATTGDIIIIIRQVPYTNETDYQNGNTLDADTLDDQMDRFEAQIQQIVGIQDDLTPRYDQADVVTEGDLILPVLEANEFWMKSSDNEDIIGVSVTPDPGASQLAAELLSSSATLGAYLVNTTKNIRVQTILTNLNQKFNVATAYQIVNADIGKNLNLTSSGNTINLPEISQVPVGWWVKVGFYAGASDAGSITLNRSASDTIDIYGTFMLIGANRTFTISTDGSTWNVLDNDYTQIGRPIWAPYNQGAGEYLTMDGSAISRTTYALLFAKLGTTWGTGNGTTTFNLPNLQSRSLVGSGQATYVATVSSVDTTAETITFTAAITGLIYTGTPIVFTSSGTTPGGITSGVTYYAIANSSTSIKVADTLAEAMAGTAKDLTTSGTGTIICTLSYTSRTLGSYGGEEAHNQIAAEVGPHYHPGLAPEQGSGDAYDNGPGSHLNTVSTPSDLNTYTTPFNIMHPYAAMKPMMKVF